MDWCMSGDIVVYLKGGVILKSKMRLKIEMGRGGILPEYKQLFNRRWVDLWYIPGKDKTL